jgi:hypothetical protein
MREQQPWKAAHEQDYAWLGSVIDKHYAGDDSDLKVLLGGILHAFSNQTADEYAAAAAAFLDQAPHPTLGPAAPRLRVPADGRTAPLPRGREASERGEDRKCRTAEDGTRSSGAATCPRAPLARSS